MVPMRHSSIFKSRWMALLWAAGILWFAYDVAAAPAADGNSANSAEQTDVTGAAINDEQAQVVSDALNRL